MEWRMDMGMKNLPEWFDQDAYFANKLASLGADWTVSSLRDALDQAGYGTGAEELYRHYLDHGKGEGVSPWQPLAADASQAGAAAFSGAHHGGQPSQISVPAWFDADVYFANKLNSLGEGWNASSMAEAFAQAGYGASQSGLYRHFVDCGNAEGVSPNEYFNAHEYMHNKAAQYYNTNDIREHHIEAIQQAFGNAGFTAWDHYQQRGWLEGINPCSSFDGGQYMREKLASLGGSWTAEMLQQAFIEAGLNPLTHHEFYGKNEGFHQGGKHHGRYTSLAASAEAGADAGMEEIASATFPDGDTEVVPVSLAGVSTTEARDIVTGIDCA